MKKIQTLTAILILMAMLAITPANSAMAVGTTRYVATTGNNVGDCSVNPCATISYAAGKALNGDTIQVAAGTYIESGQISLTKNISLKGAGMNATILDGSSNHRVIDIGTGYNISITDLTIRNGSAVGSGGGISNNSTLALVRVKIMNNKASSTGGGLSSSAGNVSITDSAITNNQATGGAGAGIFVSAGNLTLDRVEVSGNLASTTGGGIQYQASGGTLSVTNTTISTNTGNVGGLFATAGTSTNIWNATIVNNRLNPSKIYGGISNFGTLTIENTIIAHNDGTQCNAKGSWTSYGYNIGSDTSCKLFGTNDHPNLTFYAVGPLGNYGGYSQTHYLPDGNYARETGNTSHCPTMDQRRKSRPQDSNNTGIAACDIGAVEAEDIPTIYSITRESAENPTSAASVIYKVVFSETVGGVDPSDFSFTKTGSITGYAITDINPKVDASVYTVSVSTGRFNGTLKLNVIDNDTIKDKIGNPLGGPGTGNGNFTRGEAFTITKKYTKFLRSQPLYDGRIREKAEFSNTGGSLNRTDLLYVGDDALDRQFRTILSFYTAGIPDKAVVTRVMLKVKRQGITGINPFNTHYNLLTDIRTFPFSGNKALQLTDFQAKPGMYTAGVFNKTLQPGNWYQVTLKSTARKYVNKKGITQFRLRFGRDDNDDRNADFLKLFSGNHPIVKYRPLLIVDYYVP